MKISLTKIKNWDSKTRLKEIEKRVNEINEDSDLSIKYKEILKEILLILKFEKRDKLQEQRELIKNFDKINIFE